MLSHHQKQGCFVILKNLNGKNVLITGGSRGIGAALVKQAADAGANVLFCSRTFSADTKKLCSLSQVTGMIADISQHEEIEKLFIKADSLFPHLDIVINNAAIDQTDLLVYTDLEDWQKIIHTNLTAAFLISQYAIKRFLTEQPHSIVFISSLAEQGAPASAAYAMSKGGLHGLAQSINYHFNTQNIYANIVTLGLVETDLSKEYPDFSKRLLIDICPLKRSSKPEEIAAGILYMAAEQPAIFSKSPLHITGGLIDYPIDFSH